MLEMTTGVIGAASPPGRWQISRRGRETRLAVLLLLPSVVLLALFTYWPLVEVTWRSLDQARFGQAAGLGVGNYARMFADPHFSKAAVNNAVYALATTIPSVALALLFALALRAGTRLDALLRTLVVMPMLIPLVAAAGLFSFILLPGEGLLDHYLARFGVGATNWLGDPSLALSSIIAITIWKNTGYYMLFFLAGLAAMPEDVLEAAQMDGARAWQRLWHVVLPMLGPTFGFVVPVALLNALTQVDHVVTMTQGGPSDATNLLLYYIYQQAEQNFDPGVASAATVVSVAALLMLALLAKQASDRNAHYAS